MKHILVLVILFSFSYSDEIQRIESIVKEITQLRLKYKIAQEELNLKNINEKKQNEKILSLENQIQSYENQSKLKENNVKILKPISKEKICKPVKVKPKIIYRTQKLDNPNKFPKLMMKSEYIRYKRVRMKSKTYRLAIRTNIYDEKYGNKIKIWDKNAAFTSNEKAVAKGKVTWFKVSGYYVKKLWVPAKSSMWLKARYVIK